MQKGLNQVTQSVYRIRVIAIQRYDDVSSRPAKSTLVSPPVTAVQLGDDVRAHFTRNGGCPVSGTIVNDDYFINERGNLFKDMMNPSFFIEARNDHSDPEILIHLYG